MDATKKSEDKKTFWNKIYLQNIYSNLNVYFLKINQRFSSILSFKLSCGDSFLAVFSSMVCLYLEGVLLKEQLSLF